MAGSGPNGLKMIVDVKDTPRGLSKKFWTPVASSGHSCRPDYTKNVHFCQNMVTISNTCLQFFWVHDTRTIAFENKTLDSPEYFKYSHERDLVYISICEPISEYFCVNLTNFSFFWHIWLRTQSFLFRSQIEIYTRSLSCEYLKYSRESKVLFSKAIARVSCTQKKLDLHIGNFDHISTKMYIFCAVRPIWVAGNGHVSSISVKAPWGSQLRPLSFSDHLDQIRPLWDEKRWFSEIST